MTPPQTFVDRLRIERAAWAFDARVQALPRRSRISQRRELRSNLRTAAAEVGARQAVRQLGDMRGLAAEYLLAEYGDIGRRPSWTATVAFLFLFEAVLLTVGSVATSSFRAGVAAAAPQATSVFRWHGVAYLISPETFAYTDGSSTSAGGAWTPLVYVLMFGGAVVAGRLWRLRPSWRQRPWAKAVASGSSS